MPRPTRLTRREWLLGAASLLAGCTVSNPQDGLWGTVGRLNDGVQGRLFQPSRLARDPGAGAITSADAFPAYKVGQEYPEAPAGWGLEVGGQVALPRRFSLADLQRMPRAEMRVRHYCVEGWSAVASWHGVRLRDVAEAVGADAAAGYVEFISFERTSELEPGEAKANPHAPPWTMPAATYASSWDRASALHPQTLLAYGMNGAPLGRLHGGPVRLYSTTKLGYKMVKWLSAVRFLSHPTGGYWENQGYEWFAGV
jgi:DMSO/TMAO reductase YedYZ molybdopterin-dependent catalytic subunit